MLKTSGSTESTTRPGKGGVGVGGDGGGDGGDDGGHDDEHSPQGSGRVHQRTHRLARLRLWSSMMRLMVVASWSKSCQKVEKSSKSRKSLKGLKNLQRPSVRRNVYQSTDPPSKNSSFVTTLTVFRALFCWAQELSQYQVQSDYRGGKANGVADALSRFFL